MNLRGALRTLRELPADRRDVLVVRSMPFGDIIEDDTRKVHIARPDCAKWQRLSYRLCRAAKRA
jgi:hypothetical protein